MEIYQAALAWIPKKCLIRKAYATYVSRVPKISGIPNYWGRAELVLDNKNLVTSVEFSQDGSRVGSSDNEMIRIWNAATGEVEAELTGHTNFVTSVAFSWDGSRVVSGSLD